MPHSETIWAQNCDCRPGAGISPAITVPVTFAGRILLPTDAIAWSLAKREAVLAHERAHIARGDFHVHLLAKLNRAVFWFNPFAWWLDSQLAELAKAASDDIAVEQVGLALSYAEILLDVANRAGRVPAGQRWRDRAPSAIASSG
jgi:beta-lactamase regulating signal transducer with metallopeptidase domain